MSKNKRIIISITGIIIVSLFLITYTFGYVLLKIKGNENSILSSFTSKKVSVAYKEISNTSNGETISPGYEYIKVFTATNDGNVEVKYHIYLDNVENEFVRLKDITYTLYKSELNKTIDTNNLSDNNIIATGTFPTTDAYIKFNEEIEKPNNYYTYALKINYTKTTESQNEDDGHIFSFRVQLDMNYPFTENTLAYNILNNASNVTDEEKTSGYAEYMTFPTTIPAQEISGETESVLSVTPDDLGTSYYYRGNVKNNYINFANMCWRIVRVQGDGTTKLALADKGRECDDTGYSTSNTDSGLLYDPTYNGSTVRSFSYKKSNSGSSDDFVFLNSDIPGKLNYWAKSTNMDLSSENSKLVNNIWCNDTTKVAVNTNSSRYGAYGRLSPISSAKPTLKCDMVGMDGTEGIEANVQKYINKLGILTADEIAFAGASTSNETSNYYLVFNTTSNGYWTMSSATLGNTGFAYMFTDSLSMQKVDVISPGIRPIVVLVSNVEITGGNGTQTNPYVIK